MHDPHITVITHGTITHAGRMEGCPRAVNWPGYKIYYSIAGHRLLIVKDELVCASDGLYLFDSTYKSRLVFGQLLQGLGHPANSYDYVINM